MKKVKHDVPMPGDHFVQQRLQGTLPQIPLGNSEADALTVEISGQTGEASWRSNGGFKRAGERETPLEEWRSRERVCLGRIVVAEEDFPGGVTDDAIHVETVGFLETPHGRFDPAAVDAV
jgi:hypothetical protein